MTQLITDQQARIRELEAEPTTAEIEAAGDAIFELMPQPLKLSSMIVAVGLANTLAKAALEAAAKVRNK